MKKTITLEALTPVHIGSGRELMRNTEFLTFPPELEVSSAHLAVIDEQKVLDIIGSENINEWVGIIQKKGNLKDYLLKRKKDLTYADIAKRDLAVYATDFANSQSLKEQMHDGRGKPYIPGSSLKGAIRTAIVAQKALENKQLASKNLKDFKKRFSGQELEKRLFGENPNKDVFRFLQVGDYFDFETIALKAEIFNMHGSKWKFKPGGSQLIEAIPDGAKGSFQLKINHELLRKNNPKTDIDFLSEKKLFQYINEHTKRLLESEIECWNERESYDPQILDEYLVRLNEIMQIATGCTEKEAVLRVGAGSGWSFITGEWVTDPEITNEHEYENFLFAVRRNQKKYDDNVPFPKSRKIGDQADVFGFVKLKMEE